MKLNNRKVIIGIILFGIVLLGIIHSYNDIMLEYELNKVFALREAGELEEAIEVYDSMISRNPDIPDFYVNKGVLHYELGQNKEAIISLTKALTYEPNSPDILYNISIALEDIDKEKSEEFYQLAVENGLDELLENE